MLRDDDEAFRMVGTGRCAGYGVGGIHLLLVDDGVTTRLLW
jgi:hypothetical protein